MVADIPRKADIAIVGGGPAGLSLAAILERNGFDCVVFERSERNVAPRGGCLDLHLGSGQLAMREAGVFEEFQKYARGGDATTHWVYDHNGNKRFSWGEGRDSPEIDRHEIKEALLTGVPASKIHWRKKLESATRDDQGGIVLKFSDGSEAGGFKLVVGADGTWSKVRPLITPVKPEYFGVIFFTGTVSSSNPFYPALKEKAGESPLIVMGRQRKIWCQVQGSGNYRVDLGFLRPQDFGKNGPVDLNDTPAVKNLMLSDEFFGHHDQFFKDMIAALEGPFRDWPLWQMPVEALKWQPSEDVTLIGDAAHTTTPFVGDGANCAMRDAVILARKLKEFGISKQAIAAYEKEMFAFGRTMITSSAASGKLFFEENAPAGFIKAQEETHFVGATDYV